MRLLLLVALLIGPVSAQTVVQGTVTDARTGRGLSAATIRIEGTSRGTTTNLDGEYRIEVPAGGDTLDIRFIGYETARRAVPPGGVLDVALSPAVASLGEAVVVAGHTAEAIMQRVMERKAQWTTGLRTWRAEAYSRQTIQADSHVVGVIEQQSLAFWDRTRGDREVLTARRVTGNLEGLPGGGPLGRYLEERTNLYDDDIAFGGYTLMGPTHPQALAFYRFTLDSRRAIGADVVFDIGFTPRNPLQPGLTGTVSVLARADALLAVSVRPSGAVQFPLVHRFDLTMNQQYSPFGSSADGGPAWLPVDFRLDARARPGNALLRFPSVRFSLNSRMTDYEVNVAMPDSLYGPEADRITVDSVSVAQALPIAGNVPLSTAEERAFADIDSTLSFADALQPRGPLARFVTIDDGSASSRSGVVPSRFRWSLTPAPRYNRVEGAYLGGTATARVGRQRITARAGYQTARRDLGLSLGTTSQLSESVYGGVDLHDDIASVGRSAFVGASTNSIAAGIGGEDYFDYIARRGGQLWIGRWGRSGARTVINGWLAYDEFRRADVGTQASLGGDLAAGNLATVVEEVGRAGLRVRIGDWAEGLTVGLTGQRGASLWAEGGRRWRGLDGETEGTYGRIEGEARWAAPTFLRRRQFAPTLHVRLAGGLASRALPAGRSFGIDAQLAGLSSFGALRSRAGRMVLARQYALVAWEHDFRSVPFESLGWRGAAPRGLSLQVHGAHAWATGAMGTATEPAVVHHEVGMSIGLGYSIPVRLDGTYRLTDTTGLVLGFGLARLF